MEVDGRADILLIFLTLETNSVHFEFQILKVFNT